MGKERGKGAQIQQTALEKERDLLKKYNKRLWNPVESSWRHIRTEEGNWANRNAIFSIEYLKVQERLFLEGQRAEVLEPEGPLGAHASVTSITSVQESADGVGVPAETNGGLSQALPRKQISQPQRKLWKSGDNILRTKNACWREKSKPCRLKSSNSGKFSGFRNKKLKEKMEHKRLWISRKEMKGVSIKPGDRGWHHVDF